MSTSAFLSAFLTELNGCPNAGCVHPKPVTFPKDWDKVNRASALPGDNHMAAICCPLGGAQTTLAIRHESSSSAPGRGATLGTLTWTTGCGMLGLSKFFITRGAGASTLSSGTVTSRPPYTDSSRRDTKQPLERKLDTMKYDSACR
jgi:hypothetical protein